MLQDLIYFTVLIDLQFYLPFEFYYYLKNYGAGISFF